MGALILKYNFKEYLYPLVLWSPQQTSHAIPFLRPNKNQRKKKKKLQPDEYFFPAIISLGRLI